MVSIPGSNQKLTEVSLNPPHLIGSSGFLTPAALIPFCAYQTNMTLLGQTRQDLPFTVCSQFKPTVLEGQLCYSLDMSNIKTTKSKAGTNSAGLLFLLDQGSAKEQAKPSKWIRKVKQNNKKRAKLASLNLSPVSTDNTSTRITLNTLESYTDYRTGSYQLITLKKMTGTPSFMNLPLSTKKCQIESFADCQMNSFIEEVQKQCRCIPWAISKGLTLKVSVTLGIIN